MSTQPQHQGVVTLNMDLRVGPLGGGPPRLFKQGEQYYHFGTISQKTGCTPCGTATMTPFFIVNVADGTYYLDSRYSSENAPTGPIPSIIDRVNNLGDGYSGAPQDSNEMAAQEKDRAARFKLRLP